MQKPNDNWSARRLISFLLSPALLTLCIAATLAGQAFNSGSTGADGDLIIDTPGVTTFTAKPSVGGSVYNFRTIQIAAGSTLTLSGEVFPGPLYFLATGAVTVAGTIDLSGQSGSAPSAPGQAPAQRIGPTVPGPGGYGGGSAAFTGNAALPGFGPAGGSLTGCPGGFVAGSGGPGGFSGNQFLVPLVGGSGGGGGSTSGGAGGGALLIASSVSITVSGTITANGGGEPSINTLPFAGGGAGGGIRLVAPTIAGTGTITAAGGIAEPGVTCLNGSAGDVRLESFQYSFTGSTGGNIYLATPLNLFIPALTAQPSIMVTSIGGVPVPANPTGSFTVPDVTLNSSSPLTVSIQATNIPVGTTATVYFFTESFPSQAIVSTPLAATGPPGTTTATATVTLNPGYSKALSPQPGPSDNGPWSTVEITKMAVEPRRAFFQKMLALAAFPASGVAGRRGLTDRQEQSLQIRENAANYQSEQPVASHIANGDENGLPGYIASFTKGLPHTQLGVVEPGTYETLLHALATRKQSDFESLDRGSGMKFVNPQAAFAFQLEGADSNRLGTPPPPAFASADAAAEMVELYWQALARDVPFASYDTSPIAKAAVQDLNRLSAFHGPLASGKVTTGTLFRGNVGGGLTGPYISQFLWQPIPVNSTIVEQRYRAGAPSIDYLATYPEWLVLQTGVPPFRAWVPDSTPKYIYSGRGLAEWVHYDFLYQAFHNAALILLNQGPDSVLNVNPYLHPNNPYKSTKVETGFATFGAPHICCLLGAACQDALKAAWFQKWAVHRRLRPEEFGGRVHQTKMGAAKYPVHADLLNSAVLPAVFAANGTYLLPQAYAEGCPLHPSYPAGHATVAGACSAMLKAFFDETQLVTDTVQASPDGLSLIPLNDVALTVGGEVNKLAFNIAMGRNFGGIHYRSDAEVGFRLGEDVAIAMLQDLVLTFTEEFSGFRFTRLDGTPVSISKSIPG